MKICPYCAESIQDAAIVCRYCGRDLPPATQPPALPPAPASEGPVPFVTPETPTTAVPSTSRFVVVLLIILGSAGLLMAVVMFLAIAAGSIADQPARSAAPRPTTADDATSPQLELIASRGQEEHGYMKVEGQVRNVSGESLENVTVVVTWYTDSGQFVKTDTALIEYNPILAGQTSPFGSMTPRNPEMKRFSVEFKKLMGGTLAHVDRSK